MAKLTKTQADLVAQASRHGRISLNTQERTRNWRSVCVGGRDWRAAEGLVRLGVFVKLSSERHSFCRGGGKHEHWVEHTYQLVR